MGKVAGTIKDIKPAREMYAGLLLIPATHYSRVCVSRSVDELVNTASSVFDAAQTLKVARAKL